jgi:hypothetical protein
MNKIHRRGGYPCLPFFKLLFKMLAKNAIFTNPFRKLNIWQYFDHSLLGKWLHVPEV